MHERSNKDAGPNDEERDQPHVPSRASSARSSSSLTSFGHSATPVAMTLSKRMSLVVGVTVVAALATLVALNRERRGIVFTQNGQTVTVKERNADVTNAFGDFTALVSIK